MDPLLIGLLVVAASVVFFVVEPLVSGQRAPSGLDEDEPTEADFRKRAALLALRDVDYDYHTGKLDERDYRVLRGQLSREALEALKSGGEVELLDPDDPVEDEIRKLRDALREARVCPECGVATSTGARFCGDCGAPLPSAGGERSVGEVEG